MNRDNRTTTAKGTSTPAAPATPRVNAGLSDIDQRFIDQAAGDDTAIADLVGLQIRLDRKNGYLSTVQAPSLDYLRQALRRNKAMGGDRVVIAAIKTCIGNLQSHADVEMRNS